MYAFEDMFGKLCFGLLVFCVCVGHLRSEHGILSPPYSFLSVLQHEAAWQAHFKLVVREQHYPHKVLEKHRDQDEYSKGVEHTTTYKEEKSQFTESTEASIKKQTLDVREKASSSLKALRIRNKNAMVKDIPGISRGSRFPGENSRRERLRHRSTKLPNPGGKVPDDVCDRCPVDANGKSTLTPCSCTGNTGESAGLISISCPDTIHTTEQLQGILTGSEYFTTHVSRFTLQNSNVSGVIGKSLWGELDFHQVLLDNNHIDWVDNQVFINSADSLHYLSFKNNSLKQYTIGSPNELPYLETLDLAHNQLSFIYTEAFTYKGLKYLYLSNNVIISLGESPFLELDNIIELDLSNNQLTQLGEEAFKFKSHVISSDLIQINLSKNNITHISDTAFVGLQYFQINLEYNYLTRVSEAVFKQILVDSNYEAFIALMDNPITCDCGVFWLINNTQILPCFDNFMCVNLGKRIYEVSPDDLGNCSSTTAVTDNHQDGYFHLPRDHGDIRHVGIQDGDTRNSLDQRELEHIPLSNKVNNKVKLKD